MRSDPRRGPDDGEPDDVAAAEVVQFCSELIQIDTTNTGDTDSAAGEQRAAEYVAAKLAEVGLEPALFASAPGRTSAVARFAGQPGQAGNAGRGALLIHAHTDVVPADPDGWSVPPFSGEVRDGYVWGRGAVDMKDFAAMLLATVRRMRREGRRPARDLVLAFVADEEAGGRLGAHWLVDHHPDLFADCTEAIGEVGGFSYHAGTDRRLYFVQTAEKGLAWLRLSATGRPGHGSMINEDNPVTTMAEAVARIGRHQFPVALTEPVPSLLAELGEALGTELDPARPDHIARLGPIAPLIGAAVRNTANPTGLAAGYKVNVIPGRASATIDCRTLPGQHESFLGELRALAGDRVDVEVLDQLAPVRTSFDGALVEAMAAALRAEDPGARAVPYLLSAGTDAKAFSRLGIRCFGFVPLRLPPELNFAALFHGIDERVPVAGLQFGVRVLDRLLATC